MNLANKLTILRIFLVPFLVLFMYMNDSITRVLALLIFVLATITDIYDGKIARDTKTVTSLGIFLDPLADKLIISAALISFVGIAEPRIPAWMVILIISREFIITGLRMLAASKNIIIPADRTGKIKTTSQIVSIIALMLILIWSAALKDYANITSAELLNMGGIKYFTGWLLAKFPYWLMLVTTIMTIYSGFSYLIKHKHLLKE